MISTVIFDIGEVLVDFDWEGYVSSLFSDPEIITRLNRAVWESKLWPEFDRAVLTDEEIISRMIECDPELSEEIRLAMEGIGETVRLRETTLPWIRGLKARGLKVLFLSNYSERLRFRNEEALCFLSEMDGGIFSYEVHVLKPEAEIYRLLCEKYDLEPSQGVFIDDKEENVRGAESFGLHAIQYLSQRDAEEKLNLMLTNEK